MNKNLKFLLSASLSFLIVGCAAGPYKATRYDSGQDLERLQNVVILDKRLSNQFATKRIAIMGEKSELTQDNRLKVFCEIRNMKNDTLKLQVQTAFKDEGNFSVEQDTNWELILIPGFSTFTYITTALNEKAKKYTIRIKEAK
ncbi:MAG: hypothetical protein P9X22_02995 [Candidatus Zapsychrus exili]|nr:hypothetical protein [Candidatus Zapsychrus exili]